MAPAVQHITPELRRWIVAQAEAGLQPEVVVRAMVESGWHEDVALEALEQTLRSRLEEVRAATQAPGEPVPEPGLAEGANVIVADGHPVEIVTALKHPRVVVFGNLLTDAECDEIMAQALPRLVRSETVQVATGGSEVHQDRTSDGMFFNRGESPVIQRVERRIAALLNWPEEYGEGIQVLRYRPGAQYKPHFDYFDPSQPGTPRILQRGGQRVGTLVMYLNRPERGGATTFPDAGLEVAPVRGQAVFFSYDRPSPATKTLHGGAPVLAGEKWVATKWLRQGVFT
ncbi:MAG: 2OG-Fe(II) oxygenase [Rubrivivax sp.]